MNNKLLEPYYGNKSLMNLLPSSIGALGFSDFSNFLKLPKSKHFIILLIDGLGVHQLQELRGHLKFLKTKKYNTIRTVFPSTTSCALGSLGTGLTPGDHGIAGYRMLDFSTKKTFCMLGKWGVDAKKWQPHSSIFKKSVDLGIKVFSVGSKKYFKSDLTKSVLGESLYYKKESLEDIILKSLEISKIKNSSICYAYWNNLDLLAHRYGWQSSFYAHSLEYLDNMLDKAYTRMPNDTTLIITSDHGIIDTSTRDQIIINDYPKLSPLIENTAGEPRCFYLYCDTHNSNKLFELCYKYFSNYADIISRNKAIELKYYGNKLIRPEIRKGLGNIILIAKYNYSFFDVERFGFSPLSMVGQHGSLTAQEQNVPLIILKR